MGNHLSNPKTVPITESGPFLTKYRYVCSSIQGWVHNFSVISELNNGGFYNFSSRGV